MSEMPEDYVTEADVAAGYEDYLYAWKLSAFIERKTLAKDITAPFNWASETERAFLELALSVIGIEQYLHIETSGMLEDHSINYDWAYDAWRERHPFDPSSPKHGDYR